MPSGLTMGIIVDEESEAEQNSIDPKVHGSEMRYIIHEVGNAQIDAIQLTGLRASVLPQETLTPSLTGMT